MKKILLTIFSFAITNIALAQTGIGSNPPSGGCGKQGTDPLSLPNPLCVSNITELLDNIVGFLLTISVAIATIMVIFGAFQILTSAGNEEKVARGKKTIFYTVIGLAIMLLFRVIIALIQRLVGV